MGFIKRFFEKKRAIKTIDDVLTDLNSKPAEEVFEGFQEPMAGTSSTMEEVSVTQQYDLVATKMEYAVEEKKKVRDAAKRLMDAIGVGPETKKSSSQNR